MFRVRRQLQRALAPRRWYSETNKVNDRVVVMSNDTTSHQTPVLLGLMNALSVKYHSVGYFRPIAPAPGTDHHVELLKSEFKLSDSANDLVGMYSADVVQARLTGDVDAITDTILAKFEALRAKHDFVVVEGATFESAPELAWDINVEIAKTLGSPVLLTNDFRDVESEGDALLESIATRVLLGKDAIEATGLPYIGSIANRVRSSTPLETRGRVQAILKSKGTADPTIFLGALPLDNILGSKRLNEVVAQLRATQLYGPTSPNSVVVTDGLIGTSDLKELFGHLKQHDEGLLVITSADRTDVVLGLLASRASGALPNVAGIVLTNGAFPQDHVKDILDGMAKLDKTTIPIYTVDEDAFKTANSLSRVTCDILPTSQTKIQQSYILFDKFVSRSALMDCVCQAVKSTKRTPKQFK
ncbi:phosphate acetyltransferase, partial [Achlya hypogyna]